MKKKFLITLVLMSLLAFLAIGSVKALEVKVTCSPTTIPIPGGTTVIRVSCDKDASGSITVKKLPSGTPSVCSIVVSGGSFVEKTYPTHFSGGSTIDIGEYEVCVSLSTTDGEEKTEKATFWVYFEVIPEIPFGTIMATVASFAALGVLIKKKRF